MPASDPGTNSLVNTDILMNEAVVSSPLPLSRARNAFGKLDQRVRDHGLVGLTLWTDAGSQCVDAAKAQVSEGAAHAEAEDRKALGLLDHVLADGRVTAEEVGALRTARKHVKASAEADASLKEVAS